MLKKIASYKNGNYKVHLFSDGTKVRVCNDDKFRPKFPENIDIKVTNKCNLKCEFCHEDSKPDGEEYTDIIDKYLLLFGSLKPGTELAIGGGALSTLPIDDLDRLTTTLSYLYGIVPNVTVNAFELKNITFRDNITRLLTDELFGKTVINGIGVSYMGKFKEFEEFINLHRDRAVVHVIAGIVDEDDISYLKSLNCKILILGYKDIRRGSTFKETHNEIISKNIEYLKSNIVEISKNFKTVSFDCLAVEQLDIKNQISKSDWEKYYMGDDGTSTMYIDFVKGEFASSSTSKIRYKLEDKPIEEIFEVILNENRR